MRNILKIKVLFIICLFLGLIALISELAYAGAWTLPRRGQYIEIYNKYYLASHDFDANGDKARKSNDGDYREYYLELKYEYGITDNFDFLTSVTYKDNRYRNDPDGSDRTFERGNAVGDLYLRGKYRLTAETGELTRPFTSSLQLTGKFPLGYDRNGHQPPGTGYIDGEIRFMIGKILPKINSYINAESGFYLKKGPKSNYIPYLLEMGWQMTEHFMLKGVIDGIESPSSWAGDEEDYTVWDVFLIYSKKGRLSTVHRETMRNLNIQFGYGQTFHGKNTGKGTEYIFSTSYQY